MIDTRTSYRLSTVALVVAVMQCQAGAQTAQLEVQTNGQELTVQNDGASQAPVVVVTSHTLGLGPAARHARGPTLNRIRLAEQMLSHARLVLRFGSGTGRMFYNAGFVRLPAGDARDTAPPFNKWRHDFVRANVPIKDSNVCIYAVNQRYLQLHRGKKPREFTYPLLFPDTVRIRQFRVHGHITDTSSDDKVHFILSKDITAREVVAEHVFVKGQRLPFTLDGLDQSRLYFTLKGEGETTTSMYGLRFELWLDISRMPKLVLEPGENVLTYTDDETSSHRATVEIGLVGKDVLADFDSGKPALSGSAEAKLDSGGLEGCAHGKQCLRLDFRTPERSNCTINFPPDQRDWRKYRALHLAYCMPESVPGQVAVGLLTYPGGKYRFVRVHIWLRKTDGWRTISFDLSKVEREDVRGLYLTTGIHWKPGDTGTCWLDSVWLSERPPAGAPSFRTPKVLAAIRQNLLDQRTLPEPKIERKKEPTDARDFFPMGPTIGGTFDELAAELGVSKWDVWAAVLDDLKRHHQTSAFVNNSFSLPDDRLKLFRMAEARGLRIWFQGPRFYTRNPDLQVRKQEWERRILPTISKYMHLFRSEWGLLGWSFTEEIPAACVDDCLPYVEYLRKVAPMHPGIIINNRLDSITRTASVLKSPILSYDVYPVISGWGTRQILDYYERIIDACYRDACAYRARVWILPQAYEEGRMYEGWLGLSRRWPTPAEMKMQAWTAVAHGATGLLPYFYSIPKTPRGHVNHPKGAYGYGCLKTIDAKDTEQWTAWGQACGEIGRFAPLLVRIRRTDEPVAATRSKSVELICFKPEPGRTEAHGASVLIAANNCVTASVAFDIVLKTKDRAIWDAHTGQMLPPDALHAQALEPGEGRVYIVGTPAEHRALMRLVLP